MTQHTNEIKVGNDKHISGFLMIKVNLGVMNNYLQRFKATLCHRDIWISCTLTLSFCESKKSVWSGKHQNAKTLDKWKTHTKINAFRVASFVVTFPNMVVKPNISTSGVWNAINIAMLSSRYQENSIRSLSKCGTGL